MPKNCTDIVYTDMEVFGDFNKSRFYAVMKQRWRKTDENGFGSDWEDKEQG